MATTRAGKANAKKPRTKAAAPRARARTDKPADKPPVTRDPELTRATILKGAVREFTEKGFGGARIDAIAKRSGANKRSLYYHFGNKEALYLAVLEGAYVHIRSAESALNLAEKDPVEGVRELCRFTWEYYLAHPEFLSILNTENLLRAKHLRRSSLIFSLHSPFVATLGDLLDRGAQSGQFRADADPVRIYITIASLGFFYLSNRWTLSVIFSRPLTADDQIAAWGEHICDVVLGYLRP
jgi:AcrR family transcriptional regulator